MSRHSTRVRPIRAATCLLSLTLAAVCMPAGGQAQIPANGPELSAEQRAAKLAERDRLWKQARELRAAGKFDDALERLARHIPIQQVLFGAGSDGEAEALEQIALNKRDLQDWPAARTAAAGAVKIRDHVHGKDDWRTSDARLLAADIDRWEKLTASQRQQLAEADRLIVEVARLNDQGKYREALEPAQRALALRLQVLGGNHRSTGDACSWLGLLRCSLGDYARAEPLYRQALEINKQSLGESHPGYAISLNSLAQLYDELGDYARAEPLYKQALEIFRKSLGEAHPNYAMSLTSLALLHRNRGDYARAEPLFKQALEITKKSLGETHPHYAASLNNLALLYKSMGDYAQAESLLAQALGIQKRSLLESDPDYASGLNNLAILELDLRRPAEAEPLLRQAVQIERKSLDLTAAVQSEQQQLAMARQVRHYLDNYLSAALAAGVELGDVYAEAAAWKGSVSAQQQLLRARQRAMATDPGSEVGRLFAHLDADSRRFAALSRVTPEPGETARLRRELAALAESVNSLQQQLSRLDPDFHRAWANRKISPSDLCAALPPEAALVDVLEYQHYIPSPEAGKQGTWQRRFAAFVLRRDRPIACVELGDSAPVGELVRDWRAGFGTLPTGNGKQPGVELRRLIWEPLTRQLTGAGTVLVSPDGALARLPWGALPGEKAGTFLIEERMFTVVPVPQMLPELLKTSPRAEPPDSLLLAGDIDYGGDPGAPTAAALAVRSPAPRRKGQIEFEKLEGAQAELASIRDWYEQADASGDVHSLRRRQATEGAFRDQAPKYPWLHVITHGFFAAAEASPAKPSVPIDPGLLSGLAFSGANAAPAEGKDDGILTALEVSALDLSKVDTVVLSACETGLGQSAGGEGLLGLQRSFQVAGAKTVVASLWKVPDAATSRLMQRFYENMWDRKLGKLAALREAQIYMLRDRGNRGLTIESEPARDDGLPPFYWAAFVLSGDWR